MRLMTYRLGKLPARRGAVKLALKDYLDKSALPPIPDMFGHQNLVADFGMLGNDQYGDCVWAGAAHETMLWNASAHKNVSITAANVLADYSAVTGFRPDDPASDRGTDMELAARYRRTTGIVDAAGQRHKVAAYLALTPGNLTELASATYIFGAVGVGLRLPSSAISQFDAGRPWSVTRGARIEGGHYVTVCGKPTADFAAVTWGRLQLMTAGFYRRYCDEAIVYLSDEFLTGGRSPEGIDRAALNADLTAVTRA